MLSTVDFETCRGNKPTKTRHTCLALCGKESGVEQDLAHPVYEISK